jgi:hypothetical protein
MDSITFEIDNITIQLVNGEMLIWIGVADHEPDIVLGINRLQDVLNAARMLHIGNKR